MSKFNERTTVRKRLEEHPDATTNYEGALAFKVDPYTELYLKAASTLVGEPKFYTDAGTSDKELIEAIHKMAKIDPEFILKLAVYCREELYLRSVPLALIAEFANVCPGSVEGARKYVVRCIQRADELTELIAYQLHRNNISPRTKTKLPALIKWGIKNAFPKFDGYQIAKYNRDDVEVKMRDSMFLTHPAGRDAEQQIVFNKLADNELESPETWEVMRSTGKMTWHDVIRKIFYKDRRVHNYMAIIRNIRNCLQDESVTAEDIDLLCRMISDRQAVLRSKQLPFRFFSAYRELHYANIETLSPAGAMYITDVMDALEDAVSYSVDNFPKLSGTSTLIACDVSGSMEAPISKRPIRSVWRKASKGSIQRFDIGIILGMIGNRFCGHTITGIFGTHWKVIPMSRSSGILKNTLEMHKREGEAGYSTNGYKVIDYLLDNDIRVDRIMIFTDCQMWDSENTNFYVDNKGNKHFFGMDDISFAERFTTYQRRYPDVKLYCFDLSGYGNIMIPQDTKNVCLIGGWSDRVFDFIQAFEQEDKNVVIEKINAIRP